ncbi:MAG: DoxX family protein [Betaproteobacteria bacterium]|jgi:putative oxidoreductase|nr:DoxX family protein [Betaproteobacteria bacterium]
MQSYIPLAGRILLAAIYLSSGLSKVTGFDGTVGYIASKGLPVPQLLTLGSIVVELGAGLMLVLGWKTRWAAAALLVFTALAALLFHNFWSVPPDQAQNQMIHFMKNVAIMGGFLYVFAFGPGAVSLDAKAGRS